MQVESTLHRQWLLKFHGDGAPDCGYSIRKLPGLDKNNLEAVPAVGLFMDPLESQGLFEGDSSRFRRSNEPKIPDEKNHPLENRLVRNSFYFARKVIGDRESQVGCERERAEDRPVVKLRDGSFLRRSEFAALLQRDYRIDKGGIRPRFGDA